MTMKHISALGFLMATCLPIVNLATSVYAQTRIRDLPQTTSGFSITGRVISVVGNSFVLDDGSGRIIVDAGPRWWQPIDVSVDERVSVTGKLGRSGEFDAFSITRQNGTVLNIRPAEGPPPWARGPHRLAPRSPR
ncbi:hypothetical protein [Leptothermofonsia sp. ETS-13]|uniref:hypothetical protein n=1 Tax=Leptothermofonsia sp. ETS-13 TaxID=3035696 RepID=UPI003B9DFBB3